MHEGQATETSQYVRLWKHDMGNGTKMLDKDKIIIIYILFWKPRILYVAQLSFSHFEPKILLNYFFLSGYSLGKLLFFWSDSISWASFHIIHDRSLFVKNPLLPYVQLSIKLNHLWLELQARIAIFWNRKGAWLIRSQKPCWYSVVHHLSWLHPVKVGVWSCRK